MTIPLALLAVVGCKDPDGPLRIELSGTLCDPDGTEVPFFGRGYDSSNDLDLDASVDVRDWKAETDQKWSLEFAGDHGYLQDFPTGTTSFEAADMFESGPLGLQHIQDRSLADTHLDYVTSYEVSVEESDASGFAGTLTASFDNGAVLKDAEIVVKGAAPPEAGGASTTTFGGTGSGGGACATFDDMTPYYDDVQMDSECWSAGYYQACGNDEGHDLSCQALAGLEDCCYDGPGDCPYC